MSAANALRPLWFAGITACKGARKTTTDSFLRANNAHVNTQPALGAFTLYVANSKKLAELFCHETDRFSSASFETLISQNNALEFPRSTGWPLIRGYYAAFFALHALLRLHGWACTRLSTEVASILDKQGKIYFPNGQKIDGGLYLMKTLPGGSELTFTKLTAQNGGSHEALWSTLFDYLTEMTNLALAQPLDIFASQQLVVSVTQFRQLVASKGGPKWLTRIRNSVNYSHEYGTWHPYANSSCDNARIAQVLNRWKDEPSNVILPNTTDELLQFCEACAFIISLCRATIKDLAFRSVANSPIRVSTSRLIT